MTTLNREPQLLGCCDVGYLSGHPAAGYRYDPALSARIPKGMPNLLSAVSQLATELDKAIAVKVAEDPDILSDSMASTQIAESYYMLMHAEKMLNFHGITI